MAEGRRRAGSAVTPDMMLAIGYLSWPPATFYAATLPEILYAISGWQRARGIRGEAARRGDPGGLSLTRIELEELIALTDYEARQRAKRSPENDGNRSLPRHEADGERGSSCPEPQA